MNGYPRLSCATRRCLQECRVAARASSRTIILATTCVGHVGLILLLSSGTMEPSRRRTSTQEQEPLLIVLLDDLLKPEPPPRVDRNELPQRLMQTKPFEAGNLEPEVSDPVALPSSSQPTLSIDWAAEAARAAGAAVDRLAAEVTAQGSRRQFSGHPKAMDLPPPESREHKLGDVERFEGGETIEWINSRCYYTTAIPVGPSDYFNLLKPICKKRGRATFTMPQRCKPDSTGGQVCRPDLEDSALTSPRE